MHTIPKFKKLPDSFYQGADVIKIARELLGKVLVTNFNEQLTSCIITETEAYNGVTDKASHAYGGRRTDRTEVMYASGGIAYVYLCYGIHHLFNIVTNKENVPHAVLIRAILPLEGLDIMMQRRNKNKVDKKFAVGPGTVSQALGIHTRHTGLSLSGNDIWIEDRKIKADTSKIRTTPRIGVDYAGSDALLPYRFLLEP
jgi:DNA-3-methyladenine glycosylase